MRLRPGAASVLEPGLSIPYPALRAAGVRIRRGQTSLTVAAPGAGKSQLWNNLAQRMKVPTLYWSADTDAADVTSRTLAMWLDRDVTVIEEKLQQPGWPDYMFGLLGGRSNHVEWVFDPTVTGKALGERLDAFAEIHGQYPWLTVVDNLSNAVDVADEYASIKGVMAAAQKLARETRSHIAILHHAVGAYEDADRPIPQGGAIQKAFKTVELGLTLHRPNDTQLGVNIVKNRGGVADPGAKNPIYLPINFARAIVAGYSEGE